jgi:hypothetical protein
MITEVVQHCDCCNKNKVGVERKKLIKGIKWLCPECREEMKWTNTILETSTNWVIDKFGKTYEKISKFSVRAIVSDS